MPRYVSLILLCLLITPPLTYAQDTPPMPTTAYTYHNASGNRYLPAAAGTFPNVTTVNIQLDAAPLWVIGVVVNDAPAWVVALEDGRVVLTGGADGGDVSVLTIQLADTPPGAPIAVQLEGGFPSLVLAGEDASPLSHPVVLADGKILYVADNGDLVLWHLSGEVYARTADNLQPDARPVIAPDGRIAVYTGATNERYVHAIMGDDLEGSALTVYSTDDDTLTVLTQVTLPGEDVFEGISPLWADLNDDGEPEIITTVSNSRDGAWLRAYSADGEIIAESRPIGQGYRWRHQIAVAPFGINGETQLADVRTPHIGGMPEFFTLEGELLSVNNAQLGYTSHVINSPNLDMAVAGDFDGDGKPELVVTDQARKHITGLINTTGGVVEAWRLSLDGTLNSNLAAVVLSDGTVALAAGRADGVLRVWTP